MPLDIALLVRLDKANTDPSTLRGTGNTNYTWESYENDIQLDDMNKLIELSGTAKLAQSIMKIILTPKGSDPDDLNYGSNIQTSIGEKFSSEQYAHVQTEVVDALIHLNKINSDNPNSDEVIETIDDVTTYQSLDDPRAMRITVRVTTESGQSVTVTSPQLI